MLCFGSGECMRSPRGAGWAGWLLSDAPANSPCEQHLSLTHLYLIFPLVHFLLMHRYSFFCMMHLLLMRYYLFFFAWCTLCWCGTWRRAEVSVPVAYGAGAVRVLIAVFQSCWRGLFSPLSTAIHLNLPRFSSASLPTPCCSSQQGTRTAASLSLGLVS